MIIQGKYAYLYHEYINNFMGNQNTIDKVLDMNKNPDNILFRIGYSFAAGDMLTITLADKGKIFWGWDVDWNIESPEQESICELISNLNAWRTGFAKRYLHLGKIVKAETVKGVGTYTMKRVDGNLMEYPDVFVTAYEAHDKTKGLVLTNYLCKEKEIVFDGERKILVNPNDENDSVVADRVTLKPMSAVIVESL